MARAAQLDLPGSVRPASASRRPSCSGRSTSSGWLAESSTFVHHAVPPVDAGVALRASPRIS
jgi:hypothetical protein